MCVCVCEKETESLKIWPVLLLNPSLFLWASPVYAQTKASESRLPWLVSHRTDI